MQTLKDQIAARLLTGFKLILTHVSGVALSGAQQVTVRRRLGEVVRIL